MGDFDQCPTCAKPVMGRTALLAHLEFSHGVADPIEHLLELERPDRPDRDWTRLARRGGVVVAGIAGAAVVAILAVGAIDGSDEPGQDLAATVAPAAADAPPEDPTSTLAPTTTVPPTTAAPPTTVVATTAPPTTTTAPALPKSEAVGDDFRKPFLRDAQVVSCAAADGDDVYVVGFTFSGALDIVLDGVGYPGSSGDGDHVIEHRIPSGSTAYLDRIDVADGGGTLHIVDITPPLYLGGC
ncbi:hypothetical protein [Actinospongicola halichondriae]|uniref:hypothetical protein n=1 Tax=Actinospongicola halichondriae TaxID=3236844 RepID=UPI003D50728E